MSGGHIRLRIRLGRVLSLVQVLVQVIGMLRYWFYCLVSNVVTVMRNDLVRARDRVRVRVRVRLRLRLKLRLKLRLSLGL